MKADQAVRKVFDTIDSLQDELIQTLSALVQIPSLIGEEDLVASIISKGKTTSRGAADAAEVHVQAARNAAAAMANLPPDRAEKPILPPTR